MSAAVSKSSTYFLHSPTMSTLLSTRSHADQQEKIFAGEFDDVGSDDEGEGSGIADFKDVSFKF